MSVWIGLHALSMWGGDSTEESVTGETPHSDLYSDALNSVYWKVEEILLTEASSDNVHKISWIIFRI